MTQLVGKMTAPIVCALAMQVAVCQGPGGQGPGAQAVSPIVPAGMARTDVVTIRALGMQPSMEVAQAALADCAVANPRVAVVVVDTEGNPRLIMVADGAKASLVDNARRKGMTAATLRQVTSVEQKMVEANPMMVVPPHADDLIAPGGVPIRAGTQVIGGIGVEGGDPMEAEKCAQAGVDKLKDYLHPEAPAANRSRQNAPPAGTLK